MAEQPAANTVSKHFVEFLSPGTFVSERSEREIQTWDIEAAVKMASGIKERYGATPFGFRFVTRSRGPDDLDSKVSARSGIYYMGGEVFTRAQVEERNLPGEEILRSNMRINGYARIIQKRKDVPGWMWTFPLDDEDVVLP